METIIFIMNASVEIVLITPTFMSTNETMSSPIIISLIAWSVCTKDSNRNITKTQTHTPLPHTHGHSVQMHSVVL